MEEHGAKSADEIDDSTSDEVKSDDSTTSDVNTEDARTIEAQMEEDNSDSAEETDDSVSDEVESINSTTMDVNSNSATIIEEDEQTMEKPDDSEDAASKPTQGNDAAMTEKDEDLSKPEKFGVWRALRATFGKDGYITRCGENIPGIADVITVVHALKGNGGQAARAAQKSLGPALLAVGHRLFVQGDLAGALDRTANALPSYQGVLVRAAVSMLHVGRGDVRSTLLNMLGNPVVWFNYEGAVKLRFMPPEQENSGLPLQIDGTPIHVEWEPCSNLPVGASTVYLVRYVVSWFLLGKKDLNVSDIERHIKKQFEKRVALVLGNLRSTQVGRIALGGPQRRRVRFRKKVFTETIQGLHVVHLEQPEWVATIGSGEAGMRRASVRLLAAVIPLLFAVFGAQLTTVIRFLAAADLTFLAFFVGALMLHCHFATHHSKRVLGSTMSLGKRVFGNVMAFQVPSLRIFMLAYHYLGICMDLMGRFSSAWANTIVRENLPPGDAVVIRVGVGPVLLEAKDVLALAVRGGSMWIAAAAMAAGIFPTTTVRIPLHLSGIVLPMFLKANGDKVEMQLDRTVDIFMTMNPTTQELCIVIPDESIRLALSGVQMAINKADLRRHMVQSDTADSESDSADDEKSDPFAKHHAASPLCKEVVDFAEVLRWVWQGSAAAPDAVQPDEDVVPEGPQEPDEEPAAESQAEAAEAAQPEDGVHQWLESTSPVADFFAPVQCGIESLDLCWDTPYSARLAVRGTTSHLVLQDDIVTSWLVVDNEAMLADKNSKLAADAERGAASVIQSVWRGMRGRAKAKTARAKAAAHDEAATHLQAVWRGQQQRKELAKSSHAVAVLQSAWRRKVKRAEAEAKSLERVATETKMRRAVTVVQAAWRGIQCRASVAALQAAKKAAKDQEVLDDDTDIMSSWIFVEAI